MTGVETIRVGDGDAGLRLDRWFRNRYPGLGHGKLEKLLRTGQIRVGGKRVKSSRRLAAGEVVRVPPLDPTAAAPRRAVKAVAPTTAADARALRQAVLYRDQDILVINKPPGLAVQGGSGTLRHLDGMLDALRLGNKERPRLVHRLDKDTSGALVLARSAASARRLAAAFRGHGVTKHYWALVVGVPRPRQGRIEMPLAKKPGRKGERVRAGGGLRAATVYTVIDAAGQRAAWLALMPLTGRTHQLRVHCRELGTPIAGDGKYGGAEAFLAGGVAKRLHLHARMIELPSGDGGSVRVTAPLPGHMKESWALFGWPEDRDDDPFAEFEP